MQSLKTVKSAFPFCHQIAKATLNFSYPPSVAVLDSIASLIEPHYLDRPNRTRQFVGHGECKLFMKVQRVATLPKKLRIALGRPKRSGRFDWPVEELLNTIIAAERGVETARIVGFGVVKARFGIIQEFVLLTEFLEGHLNGLQWLQKHPERVVEFIKGCMNLIVDMRKRGLIHLDLWVANVMVPEKPWSTLRVIDMENVFTRPSDFASETLGFQLGFLYQKEMKHFIDEALYDGLVADFLRECVEIDSAAFARIYTASKHNKFSHKKRRKIFLEGELEIS
ncbi:lipopolysaccharide kinase InaA family protein [Pseudomonas sp. PGPR40]|uniref:lipopolysaccharide kinase InaA family protein n=1 Tax=Pseudomonas sp. PGPR40 TaxID=2913476 RepID=UPI001EDC6CEB